MKVKKSTRSGWNSTCSFP